MQRDCLHQDLLSFLARPDCFPARIYRLLPIADYLVYNATFYAAANRLEVILVVDRSVEAGQCQLFLWTLLARIFLLAGTHIHPRIGFLLRLLLQISQLQSLLLHSK